MRTAGANSGADTALVFTGGHGAPLPTVSTTPDPRGFRCCDVSRYTHQCLSARASRGLCAERIAVPISQTGRPRLSRGKLWAAEAPLLFPASVTSRYPSNREGEVTPHSQHTSPQREEEAESGLAPWLHPLCSSRGLGSAWVTSVPNVFCHLKAGLLGLLGPA